MDGKTGIIYWARTPLDPIIVTSQLGNDHSNYRTNLEK